MPINDPPFIGKDIIQAPDVGDKLAPVTITDTVTDPAQLPNIGQMTDPAQGMYLGYGSSVVYEFDMGLREQPVASGPAKNPVQFTRVHTGVCYKVIAAVGVALDMEPPVPSQNTGSINDVLIYKKILSFSPGKCLDGSELNGIVALYVFCLQQMPAVTDSLDSGKTPIDVNTVAGNVIPPTQFQDTLMGPAAAVTNPPPGGITY